MKVIGKYGPLYEFLKSKDVEELGMTFRRVEDILGAELPKSAHEHSAWWANETSKFTSHVQCRAWREAGFLVRANLSAKH
ncbi:MAG: hypothetical protein PVI23_14820, partial [Maricaulaceae bacterium]